MRTSLFLALLVLPACSSSGDGKDDGTDTDPASVGNRKPIAEAGEPITQTADTPVALSGAGSSDPDGDPLIFHWSFDHVPEGSSLATRESAFNANHTGDAYASGFIPDSVGTYVVKLTVNDDNGNESDPDYVIVTIEDPETVPVANAGIDLTSDVNVLVRLDGSLSYDPGGRTLTYEWSVLEKPATSRLGAVTDADTAIGTFTPDLKGIYVLNLVVNNGIARSVSDAVTVTVVGDDHAPVANAGDDQNSAEDCTTISLDCSASADPDGDPLQYMWELQSKPTGSSVTNATFSDRTAARPTFYPDVAGTYLLSCAVNDGSTWSSPDLVSIVAAERRVNESPTITAGIDVMVDGGSTDCELDGYVYECDNCADATVTLGATATTTDADGDAMVVTWSTTNEDATIANPSSLTTTVVLEDAAPVNPGECADTSYDFLLSVTDCTGATSEDTVTLTVSCCGNPEDTSAR